MEDPDIEKKQKALKRPLFFMWNNDKKEKLRAENPSQGHAQSPYTVSLETRNSPYTWIQP